MFIMNPTYGAGDALAYLTASYYRGASTGPLMGPSKKEKEMRDERNFGWRQGIVEAMAEILNIERVKAFPHIERFQKIGAHNVNKVLREARVIDGTMPNEEETDAIVVNLLELVDQDDKRGGKLSEENEENRRAKILDGEIDPIESDRAWLEELRVEQERKVTALRQFIMKTEGGEA